MSKLLFALMLGCSTAGVIQAAESTADPSQQKAASSAAPADTAKKADTPKAEAAKHVILFFTANRCPSCVRMKSETLPNVALPGHDLRMIDVDVNAAYAQAFGIQSIPAYVVLDGAGRAYRHGVGFRDVAQFIAFLNGQ